MRDNMPGPLHALVRLEPQSVGRAGISTASGPSAAATSTCTGRGRTTTTNGFGVNYNGAPLRDRVTRGGPAVLGNRNAQRLVLQRHRQPEGLSFNYNGNHEGDGKGTTRHNIGPYINWRPTSRLVGHAGLPLQHQQRRRAVGGERRRGRRDALRVRPAEAAHGRRSPSASTTRSRRPCRFRPTRSRSCRPANTPTSGARRRRAPRLRRSLSAYAYTATRTSTTARSARPTCCAGNTSQARRCSWCGSRAGRTSLTDGDFGFGRDFGGIFSAPSHNVFLVKLSYWLNM